MTGDPTSADPAFHALSAGKVADVSLTNVDNEALPGLKGAVNADGTINLLDVVLCHRIASGTIAGTPTQRQAADVNGDGKVTREDAVALAEFVIGLCATLP